MFPPNLARALAKGTVMSCLFCFLGLLVLLPILHLLKCPIGVSATAEGLILSSSSCLSFYAQLMVNGMVGAKVQILVSFMGGFNLQFNCAIRFADDECRGVSRVVANPYTDFFRTTGICCIAYLL